VSEVWKSRKRFCRIQLLPIVLKIDQIADGGMLPSYQTMHGAFAFGDVNVLNCLLVAGDQLLLDWHRENTLS
jgi:hypothetical protein